MTMENMIKTTNIVIITAITGGINLTNRLATNAVTKKKLTIIPMIFIIIEIPLFIFLFIMLYSIIAIVIPHNTITVKRLNIPAKNGANKLVKSVITSVAIIIKLIVIATTFIAVKIAFLNLLLILIDFRIPYFVLITNVL